MVWLCVRYHVPLKVPVDWENSKISHFLSLGKGSENSQQTGKTILNVEVIKKRLSIFILQKQKLTAVHTSPVGV